MATPARKSLGSLTNEGALSSSRSTQSRYISNNYAMRGSDFTNARRVGTASSRTGDIASGPLSTARASGSRGMGGSYEDKFGLPPIGGNL
jgi:hypothetical protein